MLHPNVYIYLSNTLLCGRAWFTIGCVDWKCLKLTVFGKYICTFAWVCILFAIKCAILPLVPCQTILLSWGAAGYKWIWHIVRVPSENRHSKNYKRRKIESIHRNYHMRSSLINYFESTIQIYQIREKDKYLK